MNEISKAAKNILSEEIRVESILIVDSKGKTICVLSRNKKLDFKKVNLFRIVGRTRSGYRITKFASTNKIRDVSTYSLSKEEEQAYDYFKKRHKHYRHGFPVTLTPTGMGLAVEVKCPACNKTKDISDYSTW